MLPFHSSSILWAVALIQVLGVLSAWIARVSAGSKRASICQLVFYGCLVMVGLATIVAVEMGPGCWISSGTSFSVMVLTVTCDFSRSSRVDGWNW